MATQPSDVDIDRMVPLESEWCQYARAYTHVKHTYELAVSSAEQGALEDMLATC